MAAVDRRAAEPALERGERGRAGRPQTPLGVTCTVGSTYITSVQRRRRRGPGHRSRIASASSARVLGRSSISARSVETSSSRRVAQRRPDAAAVPRPPARRAAAARAAARRRRGPSPCAGSRAGASSGRRDDPASARRAPRRNRSSRDHNATYGSRGTWDCSATRRSTISSAGTRRRRSSDCRSRSARFNARVETRSGRLGTRPRPARFVDRHGARDALELELAEVLET